MRNDPLTFEESAELLHGLVLALSLHLSPEQRARAIHVLKIRADEPGTPERSAELLRVVQRVLADPPPG